MDSSSESKTKLEESESRQIPTAPNSNDDTSPTATRMEADRLNYPSRDRTYFRQLYSQPLVTTLTGFSHVANLVRNPYEAINNFEEFLRHASGNQQQKYQMTSENFAKTLNQNRASPVVATTSAFQEMDTFVANSNDQSSSMSAHNDSTNYNSDEISRDIPIPALPSIDSTKKRGRLKPLTIEEYESDFRQSATDLELVERVFVGSMSCNQLRAALWPYLFGLVAHRGRFEKIRNSDGAEAYIFIENEANTEKWFELQKLYDSYQTQWKAILPDQETRFSAFRDRKSLIERDVIRCDRLHPFYAEERQNLSALTNLLMTYMMYDFDIGYVQGMSDLAGPILYMYNGDLVKSFWVFVEVMKLFRRNFELTQKTIHFQLNCLLELIRHTDPIFAQYLQEHDSSNCFFAFRAIVCQFKRELMKEGENDYSKVLFLWDTIWSVKRRYELQEELDALKAGDMNAESTNQQITNLAPTMQQPITEQPGPSYDNPFFTPFDPNQSDTLRHQLTETEIFVLSLCLSMIRRERDIILANKRDSTGIHQNFIDPKLASNLNSFIEHAINIYSYLKNDFDISKLYKKPVPTTDQNPESPPDSAEGYDLLSDFLIINAASGS